MDAAPRPAPEHVREDAGKPEESIGALWAQREQARKEIQVLRAEQARCEAELWRRARSARPDFSEESAGSVELVDGELMLRVANDRDWLVSPAALAELSALAKREEGITRAELDELVTYDPKVNGTRANQLAKRGGALADVLGRLRVLRSSRPKFEAKLRR